MALLVYLVVLLGLLVGFLIWKKIPRKFAFDIVHFNVWIFTFFAFVSLNFFEDKKFERSLIPFVPPVIPCLFFIHWYLRRMRRITK